MSRGLLGCATVVTAVAAVVALASPAHAICKNPRAIDFVNYIYTPGVPIGTGYLGSSVSADFLGGFWALGAGDPAIDLGHDSGTWDALTDGWIYTSPGYPAGGLASGVSRTWAASPEIDGCIDFVEGDRCMALYFADQNDVGGHLWLTTDGPDNLLNYDLTFEGAKAIDLVPVPPLELLDVPPFGEVWEGPSAFDIAAALELDPGCTQDVVVGFKVYRTFTDAPPTDFTRNLGVGWEVHPDSVGPAGEPSPLGSSVTLAPFCPIGSRVYYAVSLVFDSGFETPYLSEPTGPLSCSCDGPDADGDGYCGTPGSLFSDCLDTNPTVFPGAPELCDAVSQDCLAPDWPATPADEVDDDGDGIAECEGDCNDQDATVFPFAPDLCDGINNDCRNPNWPTPVRGDRDLDSDGFPDCNDCDDLRNDVFPGAPQACDGRNNDCDDPAWPAVAAEEQDPDGDGFRECAGDCDPARGDVFPGAPQLCDDVNNDCDDPAWPDPSAEDEDGDGDGVTVCAGDCDDSRAEVFPGAPELCDGLNNDCDDPAWPDPGTEEQDPDGDGFTVCGGDCDGGNGAVYPGAPEVCDGRNNDCDDPSWPELTPEEQDPDGDGFSVCAGDCDGGNSAVYPGAPELCDGVNNNCSDPAWPGPSSLETDNDGDQFSECEGDCNDTRVTVFPGAPEVCDGVNNDCDDPAWPQLPPDEADGDGDGVSVCTGDCAPDDPTVFPGAPELCDGVANDCNDPAYPVPPEDEQDVDGDGFQACTGDCNDTDAAIFPGALEACGDAVDNDCDNIIDEGEPEDCENGIDDDCDNLVDDDDIGDCDTLSVFLESFTATYTRGSVLLTWSTTAEIDNVGFRLLRRRPGGKWQTVTPALVPAAGDEVTGASYRYVDAPGARPGQVDYFLEDVDRDGRATRHGPASVHIPSNR